jgi:hypothetical protein
MLKLTYRFELFLIGSLIMLSTVAAIPIGNMKLFSNAMAIEMNSQVDGKTQLFANNQASKTNSMFDLSLSNVIDVLPQQQAKADQQNSKDPPGLSIKNQITSDTLYYVLGEGAEGSTFVVDIATCDAGDIALSEGIQGAEFDNYIEHITDRPDIISDPVPPRHPFDSWLIAIVGDRVSVTAFALCFDNPPLRP